MIHQVDIEVASNFQSAYGYYNFNGIGALIGRVAKAVGLILRSDGLHFKMFDKGQCVSEVQATHSWTSTLSVLGYPADEWDYGFQSPEDLFRFVVRSPFFNKDVFLTADSASKALPLLAPFVEWLKQEPQSEIATYVIPSKTELLSLWFERIPFFMAKCEVECFKYRQKTLVQQALKQKFNGQLVQSWTQCDTRTLGQLMQRIRNKFGSSQNMQQWMALASEQAIKELVIAIYTD